ncbi:pPIWI_RE_Y domain-containing protein [Streptomyces sp. NPDC003435]
MSGYAGAIPDWLENPDVVLLRDVATAVVRLDEVTGLDSFTLPYPPDAQRALDGLVLACLRGGARPPAGVPEMIDWCRTRPLRSWPLDALPLDLFSGSNRIIDPDSGRPTQLCGELEVKGVGNSTGRQYVELVIREAMSACRAANSPQSYTAFRRLLVTRPVLTEGEWPDISTDLYLDPVQFLIDEIYAPVPAGYDRDGAGVTCARCLTLLTPVVGGGWWCEQDRCRYAGAPSPGRRLLIGEVGELRQLRRPLRQFVTGPGHAEVELERKLRRLGLSVEMWPGFDAYDLRVVFPDGRVWAIDVKDWTHPGFLGRAAAVVRPEPPYDEACWAVPHYRVHERRDYLETFARARPAHAYGLRLLSDEQVVQVARKRLGGERGPAARIAPDTPMAEGPDHA